MKIFYLPDLGEGLAEAEVREWYVKVGDEVSVDQPLVSMETAKAIVDVPSPYAGKIVELHGKVNDIIKTGAPFITYEIEGMVHHPIEAKQKDKGSVVGQLETSEATWDDGNVMIGGTRASTTVIKAMPAARVLAQHMNIDLKAVTATGPQGIITVDDVKKHLHHQPISRAAFSEPTEPLHGVRRVMAQAMMQSHKEIVPVTIVEDADISNLPTQSDLTVHIIQAIVHACKAEPALNAWFDGSTLGRKLFTSINIGLAVDSKEGLFVPVIKEAENLNADQIRKLIDEYKVTVRDRTLSPDQMQGATITLSNFGSIAGRYATPIVVPPAVAILGCGRRREVALSKNGQLIGGRLLPLSLTFDHRAVTGGEATRFLGAVITYLEAL